MQLQSLPSCFQSPVWSGRRSLLVLFGSALLIGLAKPAAALLPDDPNLVPNAGFLGQTGAPAGAVTGPVPAAWRGFAVGGGEIDLEIVPLAADELFPGSPPTNAVRLSVDSFGADQGFDHFTHLISLQQGRSYQPRVWVRSGNADNSAQGFQLQMPLFDAGLLFSGRDPAFTAAEAGAEWTQVLSAAVAAPEPGEVFAHLAFRLSNDGGDNSLLIALPEVLGLPTANQVPNPGLAGSSGSRLGAVTGPVPDAWRAFAVGAGSLDLVASNLPAGTLYPGSPATRSLRLTVSGSTGAEEGLDFELNLAELTAGYRHWGEIWVRSDRPGGQTADILLPLYDAQGNFIGQQPGSVAVNAGSEWQLYAGPAFTGAAEQRVNMAIRVTGGSDGSIEIALPRILGPADPIFADRFQ